LAKVLILGVRNRGLRLIHIIVFNVSDAISFGFSHLSLGQRLCKREDITRRFFQEEV